MSNRRLLTATLLSALLPGLGQWYNRQWVKGLLLAAAGLSATLYFLKRLPPSLQGLVTLGDVPARLESVNGESVYVPGDHSINLLIQGLIVLLLFATYLTIYAANIRDARAVARLLEQGGQSPGFGATLRFLHDFRFPQLLLAVPFAGVLFLTIMPIIFMVLLAFTNYASPGHIPPANLVDWVGFDTFASLFRLRSWSQTFVGVLIWTLVWAVTATVTTYLFGLIVALVLSQKEIRLKGLWRTLVIIPYAIPQIISLLSMKMLFNGQFGPINQYLAHFGLGKLPWLTDPTWAKVTVIIVNMWVGMPLSFLLISGILSTISPEMQEAATVEGAGRLQRFRLITLPMILFATAPILILQFAGNFNNFNVIFLLTGGGPVNGAYQFAGHTDLLITWLYKLTLNNNIYNMASAIGIIIFVFVAGISLWNYRRTTSFKDEEMIQ